jgi:hypothetical protein
LIPFISFSSLNNVAAFCSGAVADADDIGVTRRGAPEGADPGGTAGGLLRGEADSAPGAVGAPDGKSRISDCFFSFFSFFS